MQGQGLIYLIDRLGDEIARLEIQLAQARQRIDVLEAEQQSVGSSEEPREEPT